MNDRSNLYIERDSPLHRLNPLTKLTLVISIVLIGFFAPWYWTATVLFVLVLPLLSAWGQIFVPFVRGLFKLIIPFALFLFVVQSVFAPGTTTLFRVWFLSVERESVEGAFLIASRIANMGAAFLLFLLSTHPSRLMTDLSRRGAPAMLTYIIISTLQIIPQMRSKASTIIDAQRARGLETEGGVMQRVRALLPLVGPLVFGSLVDVEERAIAIEARGFRLARPRTSLTVVPDSPAQNAVRIALIVVTLLVIGARLWLSLTSRG